MTVPKPKTSQPTDPAAQKVAPYPIPVQIVRLEGVPPTVGQVLKMNTTGFLMRVEESQIFKVNEICQLAFNLPVINAGVRAEGRVVKTYDGIEGVLKTESSIKSELKKMRTIEIHFKALSDENKKAINSYLAKTGQVKTT